MHYIKTANAPEAIGPYSQAISHNGLVYTSGSIALRPNGDFVNGDIKAQTEQVMQNLEAILKEADSSLECVLKTTCFLANIDDFATFNEVYLKAFGSHKPARSTVAVKTLPKNALIEIECIATTKEKFK
ncbi:RidA family protein [Helicobacter fennelliae]|uniref:Endoribonuclease L-PSP n=2 Tax=Helicobacter fennelliae TaxID=215 RepID=T1D172_9HELI|nr:RidA family protein [Helicobacter fennelliae]GAD18931.1 Endoribonuclease L-PSP [Helicobacter fennelliae MRY12-0050]SQB98376.1 regulatory protein endoribonuclease L-PSP [Helicobacter fennelliae]STP08566.1 regulatory protein endoribonuclease L-PSP [Helicobacter fennelliae]